VSVETQERSSQS